eukprot:1159425-Pelagomonas_calceolata.AAC.3
MLVQLLGARRRHIVFAATVEDREEAPSTSALQGSGSSSEAVQKKGRSKFVIDENEVSCKGMCLGCCHSSAECHLSTLLKQEDKSRVGLLKQED